MLNQLGRNLELTLDHARYWKTWISNFKAFTEKRREKCLINLKLEPKTKCFKHLQSVFLSETRLI